MLIGNRIENRAQVPNPLQRTLRPYVDWDMQLSTIEHSKFFELFTEDDWKQHLLSDTLTITDIETERMLHFDSSKQRQQQRPWKVEFVRRLGLCVPSVVCAMLKHMGCIEASAKDVFVAVKEGTRELQPNDVGTIDWKISFHFVFQITVSLTQFKCLYEMITSYIGNCVPLEFAVPTCHCMDSVMPNTKDLGLVLGQVALVQYEMHLSDAEAKMSSLRGSGHHDSVSKDSAPSYMQISRTVATLPARILVSSRIALSAGCYRARGTR